MAIQYVNEVELDGKNVIARFDFNVPLTKTSPYEIIDTTRIDLALETIQYILDQGAKKLVLMSHLGRPQGQFKEEYSLEPIASYLAEKLKTEVLLTESCTDHGIKTLLNLPNPRVILLQNLRFHKEETANDHEFAKTLSQYGDIYVNDAFGTAHRKHASTYEINSFFKKNACAGFLLKKEMNALDQVVNNPKTPFVAIVGGAKVSDKIKIIERLLPQVNHLIIGGAMAYPFLKAKGINVGASLCRDEDVALARSILKQRTSKKIILPIDHLCAMDPNNPNIMTTKDAHIDDGMMALDIGPQTISEFAYILKDAKTVLWNGPMGFFEKEDFSKGTFAIAHLLAELKDCFTLVGGGDSVNAVNQSGKAQAMSHVSTGGGASLEYIEQGTLPGIQALKFGIN